MIKSINLYRTVIVSILICVPIQVLSQNSDTLASVSGVVEVIKDSTNLFFPPPNFIESNPRALPGASVKLMRPDSSIVRGSGANQNDGRYEIKGIQPGDYIIEAMYIGYGSQAFSIHLSEGEELKKNILLGHIYSPESLPFGAKEAKINIDNEIVELRDASITIWKINDEEIIAKLEKKYKEIQRKYGFVERDLKDEFSNLYEKNREKLYQAITRYNQVVKKHLQKINGANWEERYQKELREACNNVLADSTS